MSFTVAFGMFSKSPRKGFKVFILRLTEGDIFWVIVALYRLSTVEGLTSLLYVIVFLDTDIGFVAKLFVVSLEKLSLPLTLTCFYSKEDFFFLVLIIGSKLLLILYPSNSSSTSWCWSNSFNTSTNTLCALTSQPSALPV